MKKKLNGNSRKEEVNQAISEDEFSKPTGAEHSLPFSPSNSEFVRVQWENNKVEAHGIDENGSKNLVVSFSDNTSCSRNPDGLQLDAWNVLYQSTGELGKRDLLIPCRISDQCPRITKIKKPMMYRFCDQMAILFGDPEWGVRICNPKV